MGGRTDDPEFLKGRTDKLLDETEGGSREWAMKTSVRASTQFRVIVPEDGEDYEVVMSLMRFGSKGDRRYLLVSHESGLRAASYKLRSSDYDPLSRLGELVFSD